jgi:hypothetical protein
MINSSPTTTCFRAALLLAPPLGPHLAFCVAAAAPPACRGCCLLDVAAAAAEALRVAVTAGAVKQLLRVARAVEPGASEPLPPSDSFPKGVVRLG